MDPLSLAAGAGILLLGWVTGRTTGKRSARTTAPTPVLTKCGCKHELAMHDPQSNRCHARTDERYSEARREYVTQQCGCRQYTGPRPIDQVFLPPTLPS